MERDSSLNPFVPTQVYRAGENVQKQMIIALHRDNARLRAEVHASKDDLKKCEAELASSKATQRLLLKRLETQGKESIIISDTDDEPAKAQVRKSCSQSKIRKRRKTVISDSEDDSTHSQAGKESPPQDHKHPKR